MPARKYLTRKSFGNWGRFTKPRGRSSTGRPTVSDLPSSSLCSSGPNLLRVTAAATPTPRTATSLLEGSIPAVEDDKDCLTAFVRKAALLRQHDDASEKVTSNADEEANSLDGYRFMNVTALKTLIALLLCPKCHEESLELRERCRRESPVCCCTPVSFDGTWHKRGYTSHFRLCAVIELESGLVLDFSVPSNYCHSCSLGPNECEVGYEQWKESCQSNFSGSSNAMEVEAAAVTFSRSKNLHKMQYTTVLCDGDSKAFVHVSNMEFYDKDIVKEDCVNQVAKCVFAGMERLKKMKKGLGGKGKLGKVCVKKLRAYYAAALKDNAPDVKKMQQAVLASLLHSYSTDVEPCHVTCPLGEDSWCHYNGHQALLNAGWQAFSGPSPPPGIQQRDCKGACTPSTTGFAKAELLGRCSKMQTQNANESFNALVWKRCPKTEFTSLNTVETAAALAVLEFNAGPKGMERVLKLLDIACGTHTTKHVENSTKLCI